MTDRLGQILATKRAHVAACRERTPLAALEQRLTAAPAPRGFVSALRASVEAGRPGLIAEVKRASPSRGLIRADFDPAALAQAYALGGATCLSVLTDSPYFGGADAHLQDARAAVRLPVLRKDFVLDPYQVVEARCLGADAVLLIMAALSDADAASLEGLAHALGMDVLAEVHGAAELGRALRLRTPLVGVNNRDLRTFAIDLGTTERLAPLISADRLVVSESGIGSAADLMRLRAAGAACFLVGEALACRADPTAATAALLAGAVATIIQPACTG